MPYWWAALPDERFWCEITHRLDIGADLKCPQRGENDQLDWSYSLISPISRMDTSVGMAGALLDHLIRPPQNGLRDRQAQRFGGLEIDDQLKLRRLLYWDVSGLGPF